jgi:hypothetical protein
MDSDDDDWLVDDSEVDDTAIRDRQYDVLRGRMTEVRP